tara:strand:- start:1731 stop:1895 length:165 start_codon:yes stop_codon:yes gene_type:complete
VPLAIVLVFISSLNSFESKLISSGLGISPGPIYLAVFGKNSAPFSFASVIISPP